MNNYIVLGIIVECDDDGIVPPVQTDILYRGKYNECIKAIARYRLSLVEQDKYNHKIKIKYAKMFAKVNPQLYEKFKQYYNYIRHGSIYSTYYEHNVNAILNYLKLKSIEPEFKTLPNYDEYKILELSV